MDTEALQKRSGKIAAGFAGAAMLVLVARSVLFPGPPIPVNAVNGWYESKLCGEISFHDGIVRGGIWRAPYQLERDKHDNLIAIPPYLVGVATVGGRCAVRAEPSKNPMFLQFNAADVPSAVSLFSVDTNEQFTFSRRAPARDPAG